jgi:hypothetical protein
MKFKIEDKEYNIPQLISIENYSKIYKVKDLFSDDYFSAKLVSLVTGASVEDLLESDYQELSYIAAYIMSLVPLETPKFVDRFELNGIKYGFFPNWRDLTYAEFVDMDTISTKKQDEVLDMLHILCAVMYRPIVNERSEHDFEIEKYDVKTLIPRSELFKKELDCKYILGAMFFFINFARKYFLFTQLSLTQKLSTWTKIKLMWKMRRLIWRMIFKSRLVGSLSQTELLETILQSTTTSIKKI